MGRVVSQNAKGHILGHVKVCRRLRGLVVLPQLQVQQMLVVGSIMQPGSRVVQYHLVTPAQQLRIFIFAGFSNALTQAAVSCFSLCWVVISGCQLQDIGMDPRRPDTRVYGTSLAQPWHTDSSDIVGKLACSHTRVGKHIQYLIKAPCQASVFRTSVLCSGRLQREGPSSLRP